MPERNNNSGEHENMKHIAKALIEFGGALSVIGLFTIIEAIANQQGALGSLGLLALGAGISLSLAGIRNRR